MKKNKILVASAVAIMLAPAALNALPQQTVNADAVGTLTSATPVYNSTGKANGVTLPGGSQWKLGQQITLNGVAHYQVGNDEYVPASMVTNVTGAANSEDDSQTVGRYVSDNPDAGKTATANTTLQVVDAYGNDTGITLPANSQWKIGEILHANKMTYYQVGNNEYVLTTDMNVVGGASSSSTTEDPGNYVLVDKNFGKTATITKATTLVDDKGNSTGVTLPVGSQWKVGNWMTYNKIGYYQVATNEWVEAVDINIENATSTDNTNTSGNGSYIIGGNTVAGKTGTVSVTAEVVNGSGTPTGATLPAGSQWIIGSDTLHYDKQAYYQVATNEYVSVAYMNVDEPSTNVNSSVPTPGNGLVGTLTKNQQVYDSATNTYGQTLPSGSAWKINKLVVNKYGSYWGQVSTNEWVWITDTTLNSGLNLKDNSYYEPEFATSIAK